MERCVWQVVEDGLAENESEAARRLKLKTQDA
jgi:hypothetical protein